MTILLRILVGLCLTAYAYIPPSSFIFKTWVLKHRGVRTLRVKSLITALNDGKPTDVHFEETTIFNADLQRVQSWVVDEHGSVLYFAERKTKDLSLVSRLLFQSDVDGVVRALRENSVPVPLPTEEEQRNIDLSRLTIQTQSASNVQLIKTPVVAPTPPPLDPNQSLMRWNGTIAWVIGPSGGSQLWFEKDQFLLLRMALAKSNLGDPIDFRFEQYRRFKEFPYPHFISVAKDGVLLFSSRVLEFSSEPYKASPESQSGFSPLGESRLSDARKLIEYYYATVR